MKSGPSALLLFFVTTALCLVCYEFLDRPAALFFATVNNSTKSVFGFITLLGLSWPYLAAASAAFVYFRFINKNEAVANVCLFLFTAVILSGLANDLIKVLAGRSRPCLLISSGIYKFEPFAHHYDYASFPSGHANTIAALCYGLSVATGRFKYLWLILALAVMASRVVLTAHFISDLIFGAYLGVVVTELVAVGFERSGKLRCGEAGSKEQGLENRE
jgi:membrane-associated phospholipid phosphatase